MARPACTLSHLACVASVSVRFRSKVSFLARSKPKVSFHDLFLLRNQTETLATQAVPPGTWTQKSSLKRLRTKTFYTPSQLKDSRIWMGFKSSFEMANCCRQNSKMNFNACNKTGDESQQSCKQNIVDVVDIKNVRFQSSTRIHQTCRIKKKSILETCLKNIRFRCADSLVSCGQKAGSYKKVCSFKSIRTGVDGASHRTWVIVMPYLQLSSKPWDLTTRQVYRVTILKSYCYRWPIYAKTTWVEARGWWVNIRVL